MRTLAAITFRAILLTIGLGAVALIAALLAWPAYLTASGLPLSVTWAAWLCAGILLALFAVQFRRITRNGL